MRVLWLASLASGFVVCAVACSSSSKPGASGDVPDGGGLKLDASGGSSSSGGGGMDAGVDAPGKEGGDAGDAGGDSAGDDGPAGPPLCHDDFTWSGITRVTSIAGAGFDRFGSVSADELTVVWSDAAGDIFYADRASTTEDFDAAAQVTPTVALANDRVAIDPTGLELVATFADGSSFTTLVRQSRKSPWQAGSSVPDQFKNIVSTLSLSGGVVSSPVISADGNSLFFVVTVSTDAASIPAIDESVWDPASQMWGLPSTLPNPELAASASSQERRPTGASGDDRTLFFFDESTGTQRAAWRPATTSAFDEFVDLPTLPEAVPSGDCITVYFRGSDGSGAGLFIGSAE